MEALTDESSSAEEREAIYARLEDDVVRGEAAGPEAAALAAEAAKAILVSVLRAPQARVGVAEWQRAALLLGEMAREQPFAVCGEMVRHDSHGVPQILSIYAAPDTVYTAMLAKEPSAWTREDAVTEACHETAWPPIMATGLSAVMETVGLTDGMQGWLDPCMELVPFPPKQPKQPDHFLPLMMLLFELVREPEGQSDALLTGAWHSLGWMSMQHPDVVIPLVQAGVVELGMAVLQTLSPLDRISKRILLPSAIISSINFAITGADLAGQDMFPRLLETGALDIAISNLTAYQVMGKPEDASVVAVWYGGLYLLDKLDIGSPRGKPIVDRIRSAGVDVFRFVIDHPLVQLGDIGMGSNVTGTKVAAIVRAHFCGTMIF